MNGYKNEMTKNYKKLTKDQELEMFKIIELGKNGTKLQKLEAKKNRDNLILNNLPLVVNLASKYDNRVFNINDLIQAGNGGLIKAVDTFDVSRGTRLSTHATGQIRAALTDQVRTKEFLVRKPTSKHDDYIELLKTTEKLRLSLNRQPTKDELIEVTGGTERRYESVLRIMVITTSLNRTDAITSVEQHEELSKDGFKDPFQELLDDDFIDLIKSGLSKREFEIIEYIYAVGSRKGMEPNTGTKAKETFKISFHQIHKILEKIRKTIMYNEYREIGDD